MREGRRIKSLPPINAISVFFMPNRNGATNLFSTTIDITETDKYIHEKRKEGMPGLGLMHVIIASYIQTVAKYPGINRFIRGQRIYARNSIDVSLTVKKDMSLDAQETVLKIPATPESTLESVYRIMCNLIEENKKEGDINNMDSAVRFLSHFPRIILRFMVGAIKFFDYFALLPKALTNISPFHGSMFITNLGSLGIPPIYHHLYDFGNIPLFIAMGMKYSKPVLKKDGSVENRKFIDVTLVCDERICDGHYYASAVKHLKKLAEKAWIMENPAEEINTDIR